MTARWVVFTIAACLAIVITHMAKISELDHRIDVLEASLLRNDRAVRQLQCVTLKVCTDEGEGK